MHALSFALLSAITPRAFPFGKRGFRAAIQRNACPQLRVAQRYYDAQNRPAIVQFNGTKYAYIHNLQGDIVGIIDSTGTEVVKYIYDPWGKILSTTGSLASTLGTIQPFRYRGYVYDVETGLYYLRSRYYNPTWKRFVNADTLIKGNIFTYCINNPITRSDSWGQSSNDKTYQERLIEFLNDPANHLIELFNCYGYVLIDTEGYISNLIPGGIDNWEKNVIMVSNNSLTDDFLVKASFFTSKNIAELIFDEVGYYGKFITENELENYYQYCVPYSNKVIIAIRANSRNVDRNGYSKAQDADFHVILYAEGFWSEKMGYDPIVSHKGETDYSPKNESAWGELLQGVDTYYIIFKRDIY